MKTAFRRLTTGVNGAGKSYVTEDVRLSGTAAGGIDVWRERRERGGPGTDGANIPYRFYPPAGDSLVRIVPLPHASGSVSSAELARAADEFFDFQQIPECRIDTRRHPFMHRTPTIDYAVLLSGKVSLLLDEGEPALLEPMDMVVQRMTNHIWINTGTETAYLLVVMIGVSPTDPAP